MTRTDESPGSATAPASMSEAFDWRSIKTWAVFLGFAVGFGASFATIEIGVTVLAEDPLQLGAGQFFISGISVIVGLGLWIAVAVGFDLAVRKGPGDPVYSAIFYPDRYGFAWLQHPRDYLLYFVCYFTILTAGLIEAHLALDALGFDPARASPQKVTFLLWIFGIFCPYFFIPLLDRFAAKPSKTS